MEYRYFRELDSIRGDGIAQLESSMQNLTNLKDIPLPTEAKYNETINDLIQEVENILTNVYQNEPNSDKFECLLDFGVAINRNLKNRENTKQELLGLLSQIKNNPNQDLLQQLVGEARTDEFVEKIRAGEKVCYGILNEYSSFNSSSAYSLKEFFNIAEICGVIPESSQAKIQDSLQIAQRYLYNQSGNIDNSFKVGDYVISFEGDPALTDPFLYGGNFSISYQKSDELLTSLASNFDSTQSFFDILDKREQLEKQNQELQNKQALNAYGIPNASLKVDSTSDSLMQTLLKDSKQE